MLEEGDGQSAGGLGQGGHDPGSLALSHWGCHPFKESAIDNEKNITQSRVCRKVLSKGEKMPSKEELLFKMEKVPYVSNKCN